MCVELRTIICQDDITICIRFNYKRLGGYQGRSSLIRIQDWQNEQQV